MVGSGALAAGLGKVGAAGGNSCAFWAESAGALAVQNPLPEIGSLHLENSCEDGGTFGDLEVYGQGELGGQ